ncbi:MAG: MFS transporter [Chloroflexi bacterium]|nr:MFS transporter [Chloroflexota bacterium]
MSAPLRAKLPRRLVSYGGVVVLLALLAQASISVGTQGLAVVGIFIQRDLGLTRAELGIFVALAQASSSVGMLAGGWLSDLLGVRRTTVFGVALIGVALLMLTTAGTYGAMLPLVLLSGAGNGVAYPAISLAILHWLPVQARSTAMGFKQTGATLAGVVLAAGLPPLVEAVGWRAAARLTAVAVLLGALVWGTAYRNGPKRSVPTHRLSLLSGLLLLRQPGLLSISLFSAAAAAAQFCLFSYLMLFLHESRGFSLVLAGQVLATAQLGGLLARIAWGLASDRLLRGARKPVLCVAGGLGALALAAVALLPLEVPAIAFLVAALLGLTLLAWHGMQQVAVAELAGPERAAQAISVSMMVLQLGAVIGPPLVGLLVDRTSSYELAWLVLAVLVAVSTGAMALAWRERVA